MIRPRPSFRPGRPPTFSLISGYGLPPLFFPFSVLVTFYICEWLLHLSIPSRGLEPAPIRRPPPPPLSSSRVKGLSSISFVRERSSWLGSVLPSCFLRLDRPPPPYREIISPPPNCGFPPLFPAKFLFSLLPEIANTLLVKYPVLPPRLTPPPFFLLK